MTVDWSQFRDGDRVRVVYEAVIRESGPVKWVDDEVGNRLLPTTIKAIELIERPFVAPEAGKLFRSQDETLWMSLGDEGFLLLRTETRGAVRDTVTRSWKHAGQGWRDSIEVLDV